jgi:DNA modification methylase
MEVLPTLPADSVDCVVTSPPYWGLRDYGFEGQIGLEKTPDEYVGRLVGVFREVRRVLRPNGTLWLNLGDSYANDGKWGGETGGKQSYLDDNNRKRVGREKRFTGLKAKDLVGIPWMVAFALRADGWWLRADIIWNKPNVMPESVEDRPSKSHEYLFLLTKSAIYHYDHAAVKEPCQSGPSDLRKMREQLPRIGGKHKTLDDGLSKASRSTNIGRKRSVGSPDGRNCRSVWTVATANFKGGHFATFPKALIQPCIAAGCPEGGTVLDPFFGSGTTGEVAERNGCNCIGIEGNPAYVRLARRRTSQRSLLGA